MRAEGAKSPHLFFSRPRPIPTQKHTRRAQQTEMTARALFSGCSIGDGASLPKLCRNEYNVHKAVSLDGTKKGGDAAGVRGFPHFPPPLSQRS